MCNLIHEEIISHPITGSQEDQVRSVLLPFLILLSMKQSLPGHLRGIQKKSDVAPSTIAEEEEEQEEKEEKLPSLPTLGTLPTLPPDQ